MKRKVCYIINPKSGTKGDVNVHALIEKCHDSAVVDCEICYIDGPKQGRVLSRKAAENGADTVVAVGGDGSVNEVGRGLIGTNTALGIVPMGSGNGMARHLKVPLKTEKAIALINSGSRERIDTLSINDLVSGEEEVSIGTFGVGFDGHIAHLFANAGKRGYSTYVKLVLSEFYKYKPKVYDIEVNGKTFSRECFLLTIANSSQFGNNAVIAPFANVTDGILDISIMKKFPALMAFGLIWRLMHNSIHKSKFFEIMQGQEVSVRNSSKLHGHIDGEPVTFNGNLVVKIVLQSLNVIVP